MKRAMLLVALALATAGCDALFEDDGVPPTTVTFDRSYAAASCIQSGSAATGPRSALPCVTSVDATTQTQHDSARLSLNSSHTAFYRVGTSTRPIGCATCQGTVNVTTYTGIWDIVADSVVVTLSSTGPYGSTHMAFFTDIPNRVPPYWIGPDSVILQIQGDPRYAVFRP